MKPKLESIRTTASALALSVLINTGALHLAHSANTVFDPWNYRQNILTAVRSLSEVNQQIEQLRNEAQVILNMELDLARLSSTISPELSHTLNELRLLMDEGNTIRMSVQETDQAMQSLFPDEFTSVINNDAVIQDAKTRWDNTLSAYKRSATLQAKISENVDQDARLLTILLDRSHNAVGNLQASQVGNELTGLSVKQNLQLQQLIAAQYRADTFERARKMAGEEQARMRFKGFLGEPSGAYSQNR